MTGPTQNVDLSAEIVIGFSGSNATRVADPNKAKGPFALSQRERATENMHITCPVYASRTLYQQPRYKNMGYSTLISFSLI